jgi:hypothetical protein
MKPTELLRQFGQPVDAWLLVWGGPGNWRGLVDRAVKCVRTADPEAHTILTREVDGERWSLLLVHYAGAECAAIAEALRERWTYGFVNAVLDLEDVEASHQV